MDHVRLRERGAFHFGCRLVSLAIHGLSPCVCEQTFVVNPNLEASEHHATRKARDSSPPYCFQA